MTDDKIRENRLRRMAQRQGLALTRSRRRDPRALDYGMYYVVEVTAPEDTEVEKFRKFWHAKIGPEQGMTLDEVEAFLTDR